MSMETLTWLNTMTLIGFTEKRGKAWHYKAEEQGDETNHYVGAIPIEDVRRRLFNWQALEGTFETTVTLPDGSELHVVDPERKVIFRPPGALSITDPGGVFAPFKGKPGTDEGYKVHQYDEWLLQQVALILDDTLSIGSAGLLQQGAKAWVQVEVPENITTPSGIVFRPNLLAATSLDGSLSTTYKRCVTNVVCDNTMEAGLGERKGGVVKVRHSRYSEKKLTDVRAALELVHTIADDFAAAVEELTNTTVSEGDWARFLDTLKDTSPNDPKTGKPREEGSRSQVMAVNKRDKLTTMYLEDPRVAPWTGTAWGVVQAVNTFRHHVVGVGEKSGAELAQRNMLRAVEGSTAKDDRDVANLIREVVAA